MTPASLKFFEGQTLDMGGFGRSLAALGYRRQERVGEEGDFSIRGDVLDVFPVTFEYPLRVEWDIDSIRAINSFSLDTGKPFWPHKIIILLPKRRGPGPGRRRIAVSDDFPIANFVDIKKGDYVVHSNYGIGIFRGMEKIDFLGRLQECMAIQYAGQDKVYVPAEQMHLVQKYIGFGARKPQINRPGSAEWLRAKGRARKAVLKTALDLLKLQALRKALAGVRFSADTDWQRDFEKTFPYTETPDQSKAVLETKKDMESPYPMDRLICGDVGYGKTEVALRAVFKCVMEGKQAAILVPTTILAEQHYQNFKKRLARFPVIVEMLSRFKTAGQQRSVIEDLGRGVVDIVIGTHRLLSSDIRFKDLGLVVVDEEQRFGVRAKEKLKSLKALVDVLTMTATPIPRTLYMSLMGAKDISVIDTPPADRMAVETHVVEYDEELLRQAIGRELARQGQVYFVHNRVEDIQQVYQLALKLCPAPARVAFAHGQMPSRMLEKIMLDFLDNRIDVLVSTTIIESGIDVQNANTLIVNEADRFGLGDLHQLRGRVGRFNKRAYAYFVIHRAKTLSADARARLAAIHEYSELGSGFRIAMEDLEIRGAGNLLGLQQHGYISAVGFDLYCRLLKGAVAALSKSMTANN